ncbi:phosphopentomutase [Lactobacillus sp. YT155]|uniref:phosphopentomutase n=1 Tax=Lactobacillus sp. YT155 TaxID=3060955 RepID=UPI00265E8266|nr:phosphopentomutase [Lactobacillus sp. YT155]MDO1605738.1 phosphopentomutase [Lactobacillus sp. YT155]
MKYSRIIVIVLDSVGIGEASDADKYDDIGADTIGHIASNYKGDFRLKNLEVLGLGNIRKNKPLNRIKIQEFPMAHVGKMREVSAGKDSMDGHWEMMGLPVEQKMGFFPNGFPEEVIKKIEKFSGRKVIVNKPYSGTEVIKDYGEEQIRDGSLIVYTSGDSVLQIAANEGVISIEELYRICRYVRSLVDELNLMVGRIIARPYIGTNKSNFERTSNRRDYTMEPTGETVLDIMKSSNYDVIGIGKINDIFSGRGITNGIHTSSNDDGMNKIISLVKKNFHGLLFANLVDFDSKYGHRRDVEGYGKALMKVDKQLSNVLENLQNDDLLVITADHGNDPSFKGTDHTREYVPLIVYSPENQGGELETRTSFSDLGKSILENFDLENNLPGKSFLNELD